MRLMLMLLVAVVVVTDVFGLDASLAPGLSAKNAVLYMLGFLLFLRVIVGGAKVKFELPGLHAAFAALVVYALFSWLVAGLVIQYQTYDFLVSGILLKGGLIDYFIIFLLYFYGAQSNEDARAIVKALLAALTFANAVAVADAVAGLEIGVSMIGVEGEEAGRVFGAFGHANESAALTVCLLPAYLSVAMSSKGVQRFLWLGAGAVSTIFLFLTGSRGGFVGLVFGAMLGVHFCRPYLTGTTIIKWVLIALVIAVPILTLIQQTVGGILIERITSTFFQLGERQGDRTSIWLPGIYRMMEYPATLITGFGWNVWDSMGFAFAAHNHYLKLWFELGLVGVVSYLWIIRTTVSTALRCVAVGSTTLRMEMIAFVFGILMMSVAIAFTLLARPWPYIWIYIGVSLRLAINGLDERKAVAPAKTATLRNTSDGRLGRQT